MKDILTAQNNVLESSWYITPSTGHAVLVH